MSITDGEGIRCIRGRSFREVEQSPHHKSDLLLAGSAAADSGQFDAAGRILHNG